jgi:hypothetical protein
MDYSGSPFNGQTYATAPQSLIFNIAPPGASSIAGGDIYLQAFDNSGNLLHQCPVTFNVNPQVIAMSDSGQHMTLPSSGSIANSAQTTGVTESYVNGSGTSMGRRRRVSASR